MPEIKKKESKTARASRVGEKVKFVKPCGCGLPMTAVLKVSETGRRRGMRWCCDNGHEVKTGQ